MNELDAKRISADERGEKQKLTPKIEQEIYRALARIDYGTIKVIIRDGKVVQIRCREKIRVALDDPDRKSAIR